MRLLYPELNGFLEFFRRAEGHLLARLDLDRLAGRRIAAHARCALTNLKDAEATDADPVALLQVLHHHRHEVVEHRLGLLLGHLVVSSERGCKMLQRNGWLGCFGHWEF